MCGIPKDLQGSRLDLHAVVQLDAAPEGEALSALDLSKAARLLADLGNEGGDLAGLSSVDAEAEFVREAGRTIRSQAEVRRGAA